RSIKAVCLFIFLFPCPQKTRKPQKQTKTKTKTKNTKKKKKKKKKQVFSSLRHPTTTTITTAAISQNASTPLNEGTSLLAGLAPPPALVRGVHEAAAAAAIQAVGEAQHSDLAFGLDAFPLEALPLRRRRRERVLVRVP
ncbi:hypothetical protein FN846DRAFT_678678, partial [Sphaerosporella brunnea]